MPTKTVSASLGGTNELTVLMPIRDGFVNAHETLSYASRARLLLRRLTAIRKRSIEREPVRTLSGPVERLRTIKDIRWALLESDTRLLLTVTFDRPWEPYIRVIAEDAGPVLDAILCNCHGYSAYSSEHGYQTFAHWVRRHQLEPDFFYTSSPYTTVDDDAYLAALAASHASADDLATFDREAEGLIAEDPSVRARRLGRADPRLAARQAILALLAVYSLRRYYPKPSSGGSRDHIYLYKLAEAIVGDAIEVLKAIPRSDPARKRHAGAFDWLLTRPKEYRWRPEQEPVEPIRDDRIQGDILTPYQHANQACMLLMRITDRAAFGQWLRSLDVTTEADHGGQLTTNIAFTHAGLEHIGLPRDELESFPQDFRDGMEARASLLGDVRANHPSRWHRPRRYGDGDGTEGGADEVELSAVDFVLLLQHREGEPGQTTPPELGRAITDIEREKGLQILARQHLWRPRNGDGRVIEHFGFRDGIAQPRLTQGGLRYPGEYVPRGELVLGTENAHGDDPNVPALLRGGSFLVVRKLQQDVAAFREILGPAPDRAALVARKMMGRDEDGVPTTNRRLRSDLDAFHYHDDPGVRCPFDAHIRRANPRRAIGNRFDGTERPVPRIARRGFSYGRLYDEAPDDPERGLLFMAYNASIAEQFEVIQRWMAGGNSTDVFSGYTDPFLGVPVDGQRRTFKFRVGRRVVRVNLGAEVRPGEPERPYQLVKLLWGMYLFAPSLDALSFIADASTQPRKAEPEHPEDIAAAKRTVQRLRALEALS